MGLIGTGQTLHVGHVAVIRRRGDLNFRWFDCDIKKEAVFGNGDGSSILPVIHSIHWVVMSFGAFIISSDYHFRGTGFIRQIRRLQTYAGICNIGGSEKQLFLYGLMPGPVHVDIIHPGLIDLHAKFPVFISMGGVGYVIVCCFDCSSGERGVVSCK